MVVGNPLPWIILCLVLDLHWHRSRPTAAVELSQPLSRIFDVYTLGGFAKVLKLISVVFVFQLLGKWCFFQEDIYVCRYIYIWQPMSIPQRSHTQRIVQTRRECWFYVFFFQWAWLKYIHINIPGKQVAVNFHQLYKTATVAPKECYTMFSR